MSHDLHSPVLDLARTSRVAAGTLASARTDQKDRALLAISECLIAEADSVLEANALDCGDAQALVTIGAMQRSLYDRLHLTHEKLTTMAESVRAVAALQDPSGRVLSRTRLDDALVLEKITCPLGVLAVIFEARPDAVTQISALALKSGNAVILKGGREAARTTSRLVSLIRQTLDDCGLPSDAVSMLTERDEVNALLALDGHIDLVIPRGGNDLVRHVQSNTRIPVLGHAEGICHVYVDAGADLEMAREIILDAKTQYPAACNAAETVLLHESIATPLLGPLTEALESAGVTIRGCDRTQKIAGMNVVAATEADWRTEYSGLEISVRIVDSADAAIDHINRFGSHHTDTIVTNDPVTAERFLDEVDSAGVFHNASTRFADGFRYGFGAEVGISTSKLHARGPVGLDGLVSYKYKLRGSGQIVASYSGAGARQFVHEIIE